MTILLVLVLVAAWGSWIPVAQAVPGVPQRTRTFYATLGNLGFATIALIAGGGHLVIGWREFWLPVAGGVVWTVGNYCAFRATELIGLARAAGSWSALNIIVAFLWGALLFGELNHLTAIRYAMLAIAVSLVLAGVFLIVGSQESGKGRAEGPSPYRRGLLWAVGAGVLWGSYFVPAEWANVPSQVGNFPLAVGMFAAGTALTLPTRGPARLSAGSGAVQLAAGLLFGVGSVALLDLVPRVGTGVGFTIAQLSLLVNAGVGIWIFKVPEPGSRAARVALGGILLAGLGGAVIGVVK